MTLYSPLFLIAFLPISAAIYHALPQRAKTAALCIFNLIFYYFAAGKYFFVLPLLSVFAYLISFVGKAGVPISYALFFALKFCGISAVGVSFFILRVIGYIYDGNREKNFFKVFVFFTLFPCVSAGPVAKYKEIEKGYAKQKDYAAISEGMLLLLLGAFNKVFFANVLLTAYDCFFVGTTAVSALFALISYALYIFFDFWGCSEMARGIARVFGFNVPKNFDFPYISKSVGEFFRRWHITFGRWLFEYVYLPLGGSKNGKVRTVISLGAAWFVSAVWHGFSLSYLLWGTYLFLICVFEKLILKGGMGQPVTVLLVLFSWVFFFSKTPLDAVGFFYRMFALGDTLLYCRGDVYNMLRFAPFLTLASICATPVLRALIGKVYQRARIAVYICAPIIFIFVLSCLAQSTHKPFLYTTF